MNKDIISQLHLIMRNLIALFKERDGYTFSREKEMHRPGIAAYVGLICFTAILLLRSWQNFSHPGLYAEDSIHYFNFYYGNVRSLADILQHPNGYYNLFNNLAAYLTAKADVLLQPLIYQLVCIGLSCLTIAAFSFSGLIANRFLLFVSPLLLGLSGLNHIYYYISLTFQMYVVVLLLLILMLRRTEASIPVEILLFILMSALIWSGPYSVLVVPFALAFIVFFRDRTIACTGILLVTIAYTLSVTKSTIMLENLFRPEILRLWGSTLVTDIFFMGFKHSVNLEKLLLIFATCSTVFFLLRRDRFFLKTALLLLVIIVASLAPMLLSKKILLYQKLLPCHLLIGQFFWLVLILLTADRLLLRWPARQNLVGSVIVVLAVGFILADNLKHPDKRVAQIQEAMPRFLLTVKKTEEMNLAREGKKIIISTPGTSTFKAAAIVGDRSGNGKLAGRVHVQ